jgi:hypothetical protein
VVHESTVAEKMELFLDTLQKCGMHLLNADTITIEFNIFEEFDIGANSFLHISNLIILKDAGLINELVLNKSIELRNKFMVLQGGEKWNIESVKNSTEWLEILELSDEIIRMLSTKKDALIHLISAVINEINVKSTDVTWSKYDSVEELLNELRTYIDKILTNDNSVLQELKLCFAPTSSLQEISINNGWENEFLEFSKVFGTIILDEN